MMIPTTTRWLCRALIASAAFLSAFPGLRQSGVRGQDELPSFDTVVSEDNFEAWREHILPDATELGWQQIPWLTTFKDGILAANRADKPLLLWTMNGHPLGCT